MTIVIPNSRCHLICSFIYLFTCIFIDNERGKLSYQPKFSEFEFMNMEVTLKRLVASRGWHVYGKTAWKEPIRGESVFAEKEKDSAALLIDSFP